MKVVVVVEVLVVVVGVAMLVDVVVGMVVEVDVVIPVGVMIEMVDVVSGCRGLLVKTPGACDCQTEI